MQAPLTISINSPLELVQQFFVKLGARYVVVTDANGYCELFPLLDVCKASSSKPFAQMRASLTRMVGSHSLASWRRSQARTFQFYSAPPFFLTHASARLSNLFFFFKIIKDASWLPSVYPKLLNNIRLWNVDLTVIPKIFLVTDISRLSYLPHDMLYFVV